MAYNRFRYYDLESGNYISSDPIGLLGGEPTTLCGDTTYIRVAGVWCYLAVVINLCHRQVIGWQLSRYHDSQLVVDALHHAMLNLPRSKKRYFYSDQGSIYGSQLFTQAVKDYGLTQSMSRRGNGWDNAPMERRFRSFKYEWMLKDGYTDFNSAIKDIQAYVMYYNHIRSHSYNQGLSPVLAKTTYRGLFINCQFCHLKKQVEKLSSVLKIQQNALKASLHEKPNNSSISAISEKNSKPVESISKN